MNEILIFGAGPAGSAAAIAARAESVATRIFEKSRHRRHKVCGEFISPEAAEVLAGLGVWDDFQCLQPARIDSCILHFGRVAKKWKLSDHGFGLSRYALDGLLLRRAMSMGAAVSYPGDAGDWPGPRTANANAPVILASGRHAVAPSGNRLFGFKAHFEGPASDAVELFFFRGGYAGVSSVEQGITNVCGLAPEGALRACGFQLDEFVLRSEPLAERLRPLSRKFDWLTVGPLVFADTVGPPVVPHVYPAGDALGFVDPFTGSGILNALLTGRLAGSAAARGLTSEAYLARCRELLTRPYRTSALIRGVLEWDCAQRLASLVPGKWLFRLTRAHQVL